MKLRNQPQGLRETLRPTGLTVLYDARCPVCRQARRWVEQQRQLVPVRFIAAGSDHAVARFPELNVANTLIDVTVVTDEGAVLRGDRAWIAVLWAVARTRSYAWRIASGRGTWGFRRLKGATETVRRLANDQAAGAATPPLAGPTHTGWPPPGSSTCVGCRS